MAETVLFQVIGRALDGVVIKGVTEFDNETLLELPFDREGKMVVTFPRSLGFHKKFFALLRTILHYMDEEDKLRLGITTEKALLARLKIDLGLYELFIHDDGRAIYEPQSISFAKMDDVEFGKFYKATIGVAIGKYTTAQTEESMMRAVDAVLRFE